MRLLGGLYRDTRKHHDDTAMAHNEKKLSCVMVRFPAHVGPIT